MAATLQLGGCLTPARWLSLGSFKTRTQVGDVWTGLLPKLSIMMHSSRFVVLACRRSARMGGDAWFNLYTLITQCATGVQPHSAPKSNQSDSSTHTLFN